MLKALLDANIASVRRRIAQGDCPIEPALSVEVLEHMVDDLAPSSEPAIAEGERDGGLRLIARALRTRMATACDWTKAGKDHVKVRIADWHVLMEIAERAKEALAQSSTPPASKAAIGRLVAENAAYHSDVLWWREIATSKGYDSVTAALEASPSASNASTPPASKGVERLALTKIDGEAPTKEPRDGPTVGFQPSKDPEYDDGNSVVEEAFLEGKMRGLWEAAAIARAVIHSCEAQS